MRKKRLMIIMAFLMAFLMCMQTSVASAATLSEIRDQIKQKESQLKEGQSKESDLASQMLDLEKKIQSMQDSINQLDAAISEGEAKLTTLEAELKEAEEKVQVQNDNLGSRLRNMYKNGTIGFVDVLLDSGSFTEFLTNLDMVEKVYSSDKEVLTGLQDAYDEIDKKKKEVEKLQTELNESKKVAESEKSTLEASKATVEKQKAEISASNTETQKMLDSLKADAAAMSQNAVENGSSSSNSSYTGGAMAWPVPSVGTSNITSYIRCGQRPYRSRHRRILRIERGSGKSGQSDICGVVRRLRKLRADRPRRRCSDALRSQLES